MVRSVSRSAYNGELKEDYMTWTTPIVEEVCLGMEVTSYESAEILF